MEIFVARQPIFDRHGKLFAYELLFRDGTANFMPDVDGDSASSRVLSGGFLTMGVDRITGGKKAFINFTKNLLLGKAPLLCPRELTVVEILEDVEAEPALVSAVGELKKEGYIIALDDFEYNGTLEPLIRLADIIKMDFRLTPLSEIRAYIEKLPGKGIRLLAEKVETHEEFRTAMEMGFELFQGYFFCKPQVISGKEVSTAKLNILRIMAEVNDPQCDFDKIETVMARDVGLTYKLLRYVNSAHFNRMTEISSVKEAAGFIGLDELKRFITVMNLSSLGKEKPGELIRISCTRARFCDALGRLAGRDAGELFTLGILSLLDAILDQPMEKLMAKLPLKKSLTDALVRGEGALTDYLALAVAYEKGDWEAVSLLAAPLKLDEKKIPFRYIEACKWAGTLSSL